MPIPQITGRTRTSRRAAAAPVPAFFLYGEPLQPPDERLVHVETIASRSLQHNWDIRPHRHRDLHQVLLTQRGQVEARVDEIAESLRAPAIVVTPPGVVHSFRFQPGTIGLVASFAPRLVPELESGGSNIARFLERPAVLALDRASVNATDLKVLGDMLLREFGRSAPGRHVALRGLVAAMLANVMRLTRLSEAGGPDFAAPECELVARFRRLVELRYREHVGLAAYAAELAVSQARLRRACLSVAGQSPAELVHLRLLVEAERQLRYTSLSIAQIGYHLGFHDPAYFSRFFTTRMRLSPREFRSGRALP
ncbi:MAG: helix-turn-helix domain-containing protein [Steroidobacteraceae bacterium]